jgi:hypothetical protein
MMSFALILAISILQRFLTIDFIPIVPLPFALFLFLSGGLGSTAMYFQFSRFRDESGD